MDMQVSSLHSYRVLVVLLVAGLRGATSECVVSMNGGLPHFEPLILVPGGHPNRFGFKLPSPESVLVFADGEIVRLVCIGPTNHFTISPAKHDITVTCQPASQPPSSQSASRQPAASQPPATHSKLGSQGAFVYNHRQLDFASFGCADSSNSTTRSTLHTCGNTQGRIIKIGFTISKVDFYTLIEICFDEMSLNTIWSKFDLVSAIRYGEVGLQRPLFEPGPHYPRLNPDYLYTRISQRNTIGNIIGMSNADHFIPHKPKDTRLFLSRGHLTASSDFVFNVQKYSTFSFINVVPQWHSFNAGTWNDLENAVRFYAYSRKANLVVYTGTHGVATLPDEAGEQRELYLDYNPRSNKKRIPVPALFWKVVYNPKLSSGMVFIGVNNPYVSIDDIVNDTNYQVCKRKIDVAYWAICKMYQARYQSQGFGYCCKVDDFRSFVTSLPEFNVIGVL